MLLFFLFSTAAEATKNENLSESHFASLLVYSEVNKLFCVVVGRVYGPRAAAHLVRYL